MLRKVLIALAWAVGSLVGLCALLYLVALAINWHDAEPSAMALRMADLYRSRPAVRDEDNAFIYLMGFNASPGDSPFAMGQRRIAWLEQSGGAVPLDTAADPLRGRTDYGANRDPVVRKFLEACGPAGENCGAAFEAVSPKFDEWQKSEGWLLERYRALLNHASWREFIPSDIAAPLPSYGLVMDGQKFLLLQARILAATGDFAGVREILGDDLRFWRRALESSDILISKMIATTAINRNFELGAIIVRELPPEKVSEALPAEWSSAITDAERSMRRCMTGEWIFMSNISHDLAARDVAREFVPDDSVLAEAFWSLSAPLYQPQDTINLNTEHYSRVAELLEGVPFAEYEAAANRVTELSRSAARESFPPRSPYNILGQLLIGMGAADFGPYARRVGDVEGVRRLALAAVRLRESQVALNDVPAALAASPLRNPYNDKPFEWDATDGAIVFRGLGPGDRGVHRIH